MKTLISIIIPVLNEQENINRTLMKLAGQDRFDAAEVLVVDGDPNGQTLAAIRHPDVVKILAPRGRGCQMNKGAQHAQGDIFLFLHADTELPEKALVNIMDILEKTDLAGGAFDLGIRARGPAFRIIEKAASFRSRLTRLPYGDQALFIRRSWFDRIGGFHPIPVMEDLEFMKQLKHVGGRIHIFPDKVDTSARRWHREGMLSCTLRNW
ncbi:MAG: TIGR04283 family arsenosugar biosynthesis glycosyltransferase, partial [Proteobacteria bacterium]|nr:TIGR04283 family arsenosugar biosynthesis glycosyltransferase [Pseudomonadota bacterium]